ncbi:flagellar hook capping FlgD N-terminal domain-containing protein [Erythrobacter sp.]|uniref:flagellar hook capping FlgD N-terminal domain-containing protein n=1 Tax=Erythrobacter sp. TaxID=1042 RepID=UPI0025CCEE26|nr:flagellar hook capping FlgD N-terminal domain-containing protein [Erythrobacter sp.]
MTTTNAITPAAQSTLDRLNTPSRLTGGGLGSLDGGDFLRLLTTQLTFQDPLEPADNEAMLAQMAQFSSLAATTESGATLDDISAKLDRLIAAQEAALQPATTPQT